MRKIDKIALSRLKKYGGNMLPINLTALIVDDELISRTLLKICLGHATTILEARDGVEALEVIQAQKPDVVFLDINMPGSLNGIDVLRVVRQDPELKDMHVVIVSGHAPEDFAQADLLMANAYITKPCCKQDLLDWYSSYKEKPIA
jgi:CheY-like chemotaxis protein